jgi:hypothetical protein
MISKKYKAISKFLLNFLNQIMNQLVKTKCRIQMILLTQAKNNYYLKTISKENLIIHLIIINQINKLQNLRKLIHCKKGIKN